MSTRSSSLIDSPSRIGDSLSESNPRTAVTSDQRVMKLMKSLYQVDQQVKYLDLQAEVESLLQQLQTIQRQRLDSVKPEPSHQGQ